MAARANASRHAEETVQASFVQSVYDRKLRICPLDSLEQ